RLPSVVATGAGTSATLGQSARRLPLVPTRGAASRGGAPPLSVRKAMQRDPRGGGDVQRVAPARHPDRDRDVGGGACGRAHTLALGAEQQGDPLRDGPAGAEV